MSADGVQGLDRTHIAVDRWGNAYATGGAQSTDFPLAHPLPTNSAFVRKLSFEAESGTLALAYSTYLSFPSPGTRASAALGKAADAGNTDAMANLGWLYETGQGMIPDYVQALRWCQKAVEAGNTAAKGALQRLRPVFSLAAVAKTATPALGYMRQTSAVGSSRGLAPWGSCRRLVLVGNGRCLL